MDILKKTAEGIAKNSLEVINLVDPHQVDLMIETIQNSNAIFIVGSGRSELIGKAFAMRLMHLGFNVNVVGDVTTPSITKNDCLVAISGSGETKTVTIAAQTAKEVDAKVIAITANIESTLGGYLDVAVKIETKTKIPWKHYTSHVLKGNYDDLAPLGTLFEDATHLFLDGLIAEFIFRMGIKENDLKKRHAILE
jgi:6-phospho-3-hexuloisomerase